MAATRVLSIPHHRHCGLLSPCMPQLGLSLRPATARGPGPSPLQLKCPCATPFPYTHENLFLWSIRTSQLSCFLCEGPYSAAGAKKSQLFQRTFSAHTVPVVFLRDLEIRSCILATLPLQNQLWQLGQETGPSYQSLISYRTKLWSPLCSSFKILVKISNSTVSFKLRITNNLLKIL